jgi:hypothetical protein
MTPSVEKRMWIVAVLLVVIGGIYLAAPVPAQFRPPAPGSGKPPAPVPPVGGNPNPPGMPFPPGGNPNPPNNPLQPGIPNGPIVVVKIWRCSKCNAETGRGDFPPALDKCPNCGAQFINGGGHIFDNNPPAGQPGGGNPPGFNPNPNPMQPPNVVQPVNNSPAASSPTPTSSSTSSSGGGFFLVVLIVIVAAAICFVLLGVAGVIFWVRFINQAVEASNTPRARFRPRRRRGNDVSL